MTPANVKRIKAIATHLASLAKENPDAQTTMHGLLKAQEMLQPILSDVFFRPEANE